MPPSLFDMYGMEDDDQEKLYTPATAYTPMPTASPALSDLGSATNYAPIASGLELYGDAIRRTQAKRATAEQEYKDLVKQQYAPPGELSVGQAFGATALAFLPALVGLAAGGDNKYQLAAMGSKLGGAGADAYLGNLEKSDLYANQEAGKLAEQKNQEIAGFDRTSNALELAGLSQDAQNQRAAQSNEIRLKIAEQRDQDRKTAALQDYELDVQVLGKEAADRKRAIKGGLINDARGEVSAKRLAWNQEQRDIDRASYQLDEWENKTGAPFIDPKTAALAKPRLMASSATLSAIRLLKDALTSGSIEAQRAAATELERAVKDRANAGANFTQMEKDLWFSTIPAFVGNAGTSWWELTRQTALGTDPMKMLAELEKVTKAQTEAEMDGVGLRHRGAPLSVAANGGLSPEQAAFVAAIKASRGASNATN